MSADLKELLAEIRGAVARGWCAEVNAKKEFDADLAEAIVAQVYTTLPFTTPDLARQVIALTAENAALRAKAEKLAGELDSMCGALHAEGDAHLVTKAKVARLMEAAAPFSQMAGEMFARNWNKDGVAISFVTPDGPIRLTFAHFLALRQAATALETP